VLQAVGGTVSEKVRRRDRWRLRDPRRGLDQFILFTVGGAFESYGIGYGIYSDSDTQDAAEASLALGGVILAVLEQPKIALSDTLLVCFAEAPDRLISSASDLYRLLCEFYARTIGKLAK
jgi:hypothetical protein